MQASDCECTDRGESASKRPETSQRRGSISGDSESFSAVVTWICARAGYDERVLHQRARASWFVLFVAFPVHWATICILVGVFGMGSEWEPWFLVTIVPHSLNMLVHSPLSLRYSTNQLRSSWLEFIWGEFFVHGGGYCLLVVSAAGFLTTAVNTPFNSVTWTSVALFVLTPMMFLVDHITNYAPTAIRGGNTPVSIVVFHFTNGMRLVDPLADFVLGYELLQQVERRLCPWSSQSEHSQSQDPMTSDCKAHQAIAWILIIASLTDFLILAAYINFMKAVVKRVPDLTKQRVVEVIMLLCELSILSAVILISRFNMMAATTTSGPTGTGRDLRGYVALCSFSTFGSLLTTVTMLLVPASFWDRLQSEGVKSVWKQAFIGFSGHALAVVQRVSARPWLSRRGEMATATIAPCPEYNHLTADMETTHTGMDLHTTTAGVMADV